jgi:BirA family biotin operon repressor/biotin-[acetyl-CoA-carboxylase] ligase
MLSQLRRSAALASIRELGLFQAVQWHDELDSTNRFAVREYKAGQLELPSLVVTDRQSRGIGRGGNAWWSPDGCLMFSMILPWSSQSNDSSTLPLRVGMSVAQTISRISGKQATVKWPNDVVLDDRKVCGILIESIASSEPERYDLRIIGIGINCCVDFSSAPSELRSSAVSLHEAMGSKIGEAITPESVLLQFLQHWSALQSIWLDDPEWIQTHWHALDWLAGQWVEVTLPDRAIQGIASGIDPSGALCVVDRFGRTHAVLSGTVRPLRPGS